MFTCYLKPLLFIQYKFTIIKVQNYIRKGIFFHQKSMILPKYLNRIPFCQEKILIQGISQSIFALELYLNQKYYGYCKSIRI
jgi:hypothetical protein